MDTERRRLLRAGIGAALLATACDRAGAADPDALRPEDFGARGDGTTNDTAAFQAMAAEVNRRGGGTVALRPITYVVGRQAPLASPQGPWAYGPIDVMAFERLRAPLVVRGNGARLRCAAGLRFGTFDPATGRATKRPMPNLRQGELATPYRAMIFVRGCSELVEITDLELDGNLPGLVIGGPYGDTGHQIPAIGIFLKDNFGPEVIRDVYSHHHAQDGIEVDGIGSRRARSRFERVRMDYNARQGLSMIGGRGYDFVDCRFSHTGRSKLYSAPGAGLDIEAEGEKQNRDFTFLRCTFADNAGVGMLVAPGDNREARFEACTFIGTTTWSAWPMMPFVRFENCTFVGAIVNVFPNADPLQATQFRRCRFTDDRRLTPTGAAYNQLLADLGGGTANVLFDDCEFRAIAADKVLPWSPGETRYNNCRFYQAGKKIAYTRGIFTGACTFRTAGPLDLYGSTVRGKVTINGTPFRPG